MKLILPMREYSRVDHVNLFHKGLAKIHLTNHLNNNFIIGHGMMYYLQTKGVCIDVLIPVVVTDYTSILYNISYIPVQLITF